MPQERRSPTRGFDWLAFLVRVLVIAGLGTTFLIERIRKHDAVGTLLVVSIGYVILPFMAYIQTRYFNMKGLGWIVGSVKRMAHGQDRDGATRS
jgi:hypothetical protein